MKLGTLLLGIVGNLDKIRGSWKRGGGIFQYGHHSDFKVYYWENEAKLTWHGVELLL